MIKTARVVLYVLVSAIVYILLVIYAVNIFVVDADAQPRINLSKIATIESSNNPKAYNWKSGAKGKFQITSICLKEYNNYHPNDKVHTKQLWDARVNTRIAKWMLNKRIPQMLRHYKKPVTIDNILISYNAGIAYVVHNKRLPNETKEYLIKYKREMK